MDIVFRPRVSAMGGFGCHGQGGDSTRAMEPVSRTPAPHKAHQRRQSSAFNRPSRLRELTHRGQDPLLAERNVSSDPRRAVWSDVQLHCMLCLAYPKTHQYVTDLLAISPGKRNCGEPSIPIHRPTPRPSITCSVVFPSQPKSAHLELELF